MSAVPLSRRFLLADRLRLALSIAGTGVSIALVILLGGLVEGMSRQVIAYVQNSRADYYVCQKGIVNFLGAGSVLPKAVARKAAAVSGVVTAAPVLVRTTLLEMPDRRVQAVVLGYEPARGGGPWQLSAGRQVSSDREVVVDRALAQRYGLQIGARLEILDEDFTIVGLSEGTAFWVANFLFIRHDALADLAHAQGSTGFVLVTADGPAIEARLRAALPDIEIVPRATIEANDLRVLADGYGLPLRLMVSIALLVGGLLVGLTIYTAAAERAREYGVLKAIGSANRVLYGLVIRQTLVVIGIGSAGGLASAYLLSQAIVRFAPQYLIVLSRQTLLQAGGGALVIGVLAALVPACWVGRMDPASAFRG